jgi:predicted nucleic acid-binding Zn ribbon protein
MTRKKCRKPEGIGGIVNQVIKKLDTKTHGAREEIVAAWDKAIEPEAKFHAKPIAIKKNILTIEVDSSTWLYMLNLKKRSILGAMRVTLGETKIEDIRFRMGEIG